MKKQNDMKRAPGGIPEDVAGVPETIEPREEGAIPEDVAGVPEKPPVEKPRPDR